MDRIKQNAQHRTSVEGERKLRIVRFLVNKRIRYGVLKDDIIHSLRGNPFVRVKALENSIAFEGSTYRLNEVRLLAPCLPSKLVCLGLNYRRHAEEFKADVPSAPLIFLKPPSSRNRS